MGFGPRFGSRVKKPKGSQLFWGTTILRNTMCSAKRPVLGEKTGCSGAVPEMEQTWQQKSGARSLLHVAKLRLSHEGEANVDMQALTSLAGKTKSHRSQATVPVEHRCPSPGYASTSAAVALPEANLCHLSHNQNPVVKWSTQNYVKN